ncbi:18130_t:CDS:2, partial [Cetraspora pellucida]
KAAFFIYLSLFCYGYDYNTIEVNEAMFNTNFLGDEPDFNTYLLNNKPNMGPNNEPNMKPNNEPDMEPDNKPDMEPGNKPDIKPNNESDIEPVESDIEPMETNLDCNDESSNESGGWSSYEDISLISPPNLHTEMTFSSWTIVNKSIKAFAYHNGFSPIKDKSLEKQRNKSFARIDCPWKIHIQFQKKSRHLRVSSFVDKHESHPLTPVNCQFAPQYQRLTQEISKNIKFYTQEGHLEATDQYRLLKASYPHYTLHKKDIYNAIQQFRNESDPNLNDAARLLEYLLNQKHNNNNLYVEYKFDQRTNALTNLFWMMPHQISLWDH